MILPPPPPHFQRLLRQSCAHKKAKHKADRRARRRAAVEKLEDRRVLTLPVGGYNLWITAPGNFNGLPVSYPCQGASQLSQSSSEPASNSSAAVTSSGTMYGSGVDQRKVASIDGLTPTNLGTIFGQSLLVNSSPLAQSGTGQSLYIPGFFMGTGHALWSPGTAMFGPELSVNQMAQLLDNVGNWNLSTGVDQGATKVTAVDGSITYTFDLTASGYQARYGVHASLIHDSRSKQYVLVTEAGDILTFSDFTFDPNDYSGFDVSPGQPLPQMPAGQGEIGQLTSITDAGMNRATFYYDDPATYASPQVNGSTYTYHLVSVTLTPSGSSAVADEYDYKYNSPVSTTLCSDVQLFRLNGGAKPSLPIQQAHYVYYGASDPNGLSGEMELATIEGPAPR